MDGRRSQGDSRPLLAASLRSRVDWVDPVASKETPISISKPHTAGMLTYVYTPPLQILMLQEQLESSGNW